MKWVNQGTKKQKQLVKAYDESNYYCLEHCYYNASNAKYQAFRRCQQMMANFKGYGLQITSFNTFSFTVAFCYIHPENGNIILCTITKDNVYFCDYV